MHIMTIMMTIDIGDAEDADDIVGDNNDVIQVWCSEHNETCIETLCPEGMELKVFFQIKHFFDYYYFNSSI